MCSCVVQCPRGWSHGPRITRVRVSAQSPPPPSPYPPACCPQIFEAQRAAEEARLKREREERERREREEAERAAAEAEAARKAEEAAAAAAAAEAAAAAATAPAAGGAGGGSAPLSDDHARSVLAKVRTMRTDLKSKGAVYKDTDFAGLPALGEVKAKNNVLWGRATGFASKITVVEGFDPNDISQGELGPICPPPPPPSPWLDFTARFAPPPPAPARQEAWATATCCRRSRCWRRTRGTWRMCC
jgi:hypothetical protein